MPDGSPHTAVRAWLAWRAARHAATGAAGIDPLQAMLHDQWPQLGVPPLDRCTPEQARRVLDAIARLDYSTRPFGPQPGDSPVDPTPI